MRVKFSVFKKLLFFFFLTLFVTGGILVPAKASTDDIQAKIEEANQQIEILSKQIAQYQLELKKAGADKKTLQAALRSLDIQRNKIEAQIKTTQNQTHITELQIQELGGQIQDTKKIITTYKVGIAKTLRYINQTDSNTILIQLLSAKGISDIWDTIEENIKIQDTFRQKAQELQNQQRKLADKQNMAEEKKKLLAEQNKTLASNKQNLNNSVNSKKQLLTETKNKESNFQKLLAQAKAELKGFTDFAKNAGGSKLLFNQTSCDKWGCYYNQRDSSWGASSLNGTEYTLASAGCLVTSMAMVLTHYNYRTTPADINNNPNNFASYFPALLLKTISVSGVTATRVASTIDATLATGNPVIVGMYVSGGTHFVVLLSGSDGNYTMRDPYIPSGKDINFSDHYNLKEIYSIAKVVTK